MRTKPNPSAFAALLLATTTFAPNAEATPQTIAQMHDHRRLILIAAPKATDPQVIAQTAILSHWKSEAADRDISIITITATTVTGATDKAQTLRRHYHLTPGKFQVLLIGKDGHVAMRSAHPITADQLRDTIDAMPMRQAGQH